MINYPIDAVITWVDGEDPKHKAKRMEYGNDNMFKAEDIAGDTRFTSIGEIFYCVASLNRYAPWLNKIYIVTDEQNPMLDDFIVKHFPDKHIPIEIVDHKTIFKGYEEHLPTFNSISIESMTWRIPGLCEHYIEFNDDLILAAPVTPEDFFTPDGKVICYGKKSNSFLVKLSRMIKYRKDGSKKVTFKETMLNAASLLGKHRYFIKLYHTPKGLLKSFYEKFFAGHPEQLTENIKHRFRHYSQYNPQEVQVLQLYREGLCELRDVNKNLIYLKPKNNFEYTKKKLARFSAAPECKFGCFNSIDQTEEQERNLIIEWIEKRIGLK
ncbi:MAG: Stealth CR1 domain-containing protein [Bacteroidaceae bacterium]|nr:Stealth CR1 domain-containing protein [Bacteroidaceae bacterium]